MRLFMLLEVFRILILLKNIPLYLWRVVSKLDNSFPSIPPPEAVWLKQTVPLFLQHARGLRARCLSSLSQCRVEHQVTTMATLPSVRVFLHLAALETQLLNLATLMVSRTVGQFIPSFLSCFIYTTNIRSVQYTNCSYLGVLQCHKSGTGIGDLVVLAGVSKYHRVWVRRAIFERCRI
jgi:hypothetical protein